MKKEKNFGNFICLFGAIGMLLVLGACSPERDEHSFPPMIYDEQAFLREIEAADNLITLNETRSNYAIALKKSEAVTNALRKKWRRLAAKVEVKGEKIGKLCDEAELIEFDFERIGPDRYRLYYLFRVLKPFSTNCGIYLIGRLPPPDRKLLPADARKNGYLRWHFNPLPPTSFWEKGQYLVVTHDITAPDLPLELATNFDTPQERHGIQLPVGIMAHLNDQPIDSKNVETIDDVFELYDLTRYCHGRSGAAGDLIKRHYHDLLSRLQPKASVSDSMDFYDWKFKNLGSGYGRIYLLFKVLKPLNSDYRLAVHGLVAPADMDKLSAARRKKGKKSEQWTFLPSPPPTSWQTGKFIVITKDIPVKPIEYDLFALFYDRREGAYGDKFTLGKATPKELRNPE